MKSPTYISTRGETTLSPNNPNLPLDFEEVTLRGLATDGGLYVPREWHTFSTDEISEMCNLDYAQLATRIIARFTGDCIPTEMLQQIIARAYQHFPHPAIAPLRELGDSLHFLELFHGPTYAFKDFALQFLGQTFTHFLTKRGQTRTIIGATSGDTGSAAIAAVRGLDAVKLYMLHPHARVSEVQRRQMTTVQDANIHNLAIDGTFDDCQNLVKEMFSDEKFRARHQLSAVNSINWARICAQTVYYFYAALKLSAPSGKVPAVNFAVPSGNFGNVFAGYVARAMGLPINRLIIGCNRNDILARFFSNGQMKQQDTLHATISPSMDIQISSNFERYLFELLGRDSARIKTLMAKFSVRGEFTIPQKPLQQARALFSALSLSDEETRAEIKRIHQHSGELIDPHSAIGIAAARKFAEPGIPTIALGTAHPAKFSEAVQAAIAEKNKGTQTRVPTPKPLQEIMHLPEKMQRVPNDLSTVKEIIERGRKN